MLSGPIAQPARLAHPGTPSPHPCYARRSQRTEPPLPARARPWIRELVSSPSGLGEERNCEMREKRRFQGDAAALPLTARIGGILVAGVVAAALTSLVGCGGGREKPGDRDRKTVLEIVSGSENEAFFWKLDATGKPIKEGDANAESEII